MTDREKVFQGLKCCANGNSCSEKCPYDKFGDSWDDCVPQLARDALILLKEQEPIVSWISVKDRLPEKGMEVLTAVYGTDVIMLQKGESLNDAIRRAFSGPGRVEVGCIDEDGYWVECTFGGPMIIAPKYWMPMPTAPEPPEEVSGDAYER